MNSKMFQDGIKVPKARIAVLVGTKGQTKRKIQNQTQTFLKIDPREGEVLIESDDSVQILITKSIIQAIARGFNPEKALHLLDDEYHLEIMDISEYAKKSKNRLFTLRSRLIGSKGKAKKSLEQLTHTEIEVYGKTVAILGKHENVLLCKHAVNNLLQGSKHGNVYAFISKRRKDNFL